MKELWATVAVKVKEIGSVKVTDCESLDLHDTEADARMALEKGLRCGDEAMALFALEGVYQIEAIKLIKI